ncbi:unnamed protein product [Dovyalis caffra]|uniref:Uncharacterized protein n=1 Tax=Dovyalis caffra TaxID=77055 RepID=A0AAV1S831_9ROSI|nr:unnamed protein product [Dovyalis caffra]
MKTAMVYVVKKPVVASKVGDDSSSTRLHLLAKIMGATMVKERIVAGNSGVMVANIGDSLVLQRTKRLVDLNADFNMEFVVLSINGWVDLVSIQTFSTPIQLGGVIKAYRTYNKDIYYSDIIVFQNCACPLDKSK